MRCVRLTGMLAALMLVVAMPSTVAGQQRSGSTVLEFLAAIDRGDIDAALFRVLPTVEVTLLDGTVVTGKDELRPHLEDFPRPVVILEHRNLRRMAYEARITAGGTPLKLTFRGMVGIAGFVIEMDEPLSPPPTADEAPPADEARRTASGHTVNEKRSLRLCPREFGSGA